MTARDVSTSTSWAVTDRPYNLITLRLTGKSFTTILGSIR